MNPCNIPPHAFGCGAIPPFCYPSFPNMASFMNFNHFLHMSYLTQQMANMHKHMPAPMFTPPSQELFIPPQNFNFNVNIQSNSGQNQSFQPINVLPEDPNICLEAQVKYMVQFFINNYGIIRMKDLKEEKKRYAQWPILCQLFDTLASKYAMTTKTREELVKWIIRRVLMTGKQTIKGGKKMNQKTLSSILCKRYFKPCKESPGSHEEDDSQEDWSEEVLPYKKSSKNKTINMNFIEEIFESEEFQQDYETFLNQFEDIIEKDTKEKMSRFLTFVLDCVEKNTLGEIMKYKRVPWLKMWVEKASKIAYELEDKTIEKKCWKQVKIDDS